MGELTDRQTQKYIRRGRGRGWKNLLWWLFGFLTPLILIGTAAAVAVFAIPVSTYTGGNEFFIPEIANGTIFNFVQNYTKYTVADLPIVEKLLRQYVDEGELNKYIELNYDNINGIKLDGSTFDDKDFDINNYVTVTASIRSLGFENEMGDFGKLSAFSSWDEVTEEVDTSASNFDPKLYYYKVNTASSSSKVKCKPITDPSGNTYARAFNDDKSKVEGATLPYYYPALFDLPIFDMTNVIGNRVGTSKAVSLLNMFGIESTSMLGKIVGDRTVTGLSTLSTKDIKLSVIMDLSQNAKLSSILTSVTGVEKANDITLADMEKEWNTSAIKLSTVMDFSQNEKLTAILTDLTGASDVNEITLGDLESDLNTDNIRLETFLPEAQNQSLYDIIRSAQNLEPGSVIRIGSLNGINTDNIKMTVVIPYDTDSTDLYRILSSCCRDENGDPIAPENITVRDVHKMQSDKARLADLLKNTTADSQIAKILASACNKSYEALTVGDLSSFNAQNIKIKDIGTIDDSTFNILAQGSGFTGDKENLTVGAIETFNIKNVYITNVIGQTTENEKLYTILESTLGVTRANMKVSDLDNFNINNCKLSTILSTTNNETLFSILNDATGKDQDTITVGDLDSGINFDNVKLTSLLPYAGNEKMYDILVECTSATSYTEVTIDSLKAFSTGDLHLSTIVDYTGNEKMYDILVECTPATNYSEVTVSSLSSFSTDNLHLCKVLDPATNGPLYDILREGLGAADNESIKMSDFSSFDITTVSLKTVLTDKNGNAIVTGNAILDKLREDETVTIGNIGTKFDEIELYEAYGADVFTTDSSLSVRKDKYRREQQSDGYHYILDASGTYYVSKNANTWLLFCYDVVSVNGSNGCPTEYKPSTANFGNLADGNLSTKITATTIYNLIAGGIISEGGTPYKDAVTAMTIDAVIAAINAVS
ncbi:MAG: hypothetical protein K6B65_00570 [Bacilli bacterium]|nr:hypothetical protein [Bacilli bacterium]